MRRQGRREGVAAFPLFVAAVGSAAAVGFVISGDWGLLVVAGLILLAASKFQRTLTNPTPTRRGEIDTRLVIALVSVVLIGLIITGGVQEQPWLLWPSVLGGFTIPWWGKRLC
jgi:hypothetical protein